MGLFIPLFIGEHVVRKMVEAGIELLEQTGAVGLEVGAGADFGIAYVGNVGEEEVKDFTALGDVVNTAARLQARAEPAQLILSERVYEAVRDRFPTLEPVELELKGKNLCLSIGVPSGWTARLPAPVGLTQAKGMSRTRRDRCFR